MNISNNFHGKGRSFIVSPSQFEEYEYRRFIEESCLEEGISIRNSSEGFLIKGEGLEHLESFTYSSLEEAGVSALNSVGVNTPTLSQWAAGMRQEEINEVKIFVKDALSSLEFKESIHSFDANNTFECLLENDILQVGILEEEEGYIVAVAANLKYMEIDSVDIVSMLKIDTRSFEVDFEDYVEKVASRLRLELKSCGFKTKYKTSQYTTKTYTDFDKKNFNEEAKVLNELIKQGSEYYQIFNRENQSKLNF